MSPTEQARGDSGKERKLHRWQNGEKTLGETRLSRGASSPPARQISSLFQLQQSQSVSGPLVPGVFPRWMSRWRGPHWRSVSGAHLGGVVIVSSQVFGHLYRLREFRRFLILKTGFVLPSHTSFCHVIFVVIRLEKHLVTQHQIMLLFI